MIRNVRHKRILRGLPIAICFFYCRFLEKRESEGEERAQRERESEREREIEREREWEREREREKVERNRYKKER